MNKPVEIQVSGVCCWFRDGYLVKFGAYRSTLKDVAERRAGPRPIREVEKLMNAAEKHGEKFICDKRARRIPIYRIRDPETCS